MNQHRVTAMSSAALGVLLFLTVALMNVPGEATDGELVRWWQESANRWTGVWSGLAAIGVAVAAAVLGHGLGLLPGARESAWMAFARTMATAVMCLWLVTGALRATVAHLVDVMGWPLPEVDVLRALTGANYVLLGLSGMAVLGLMILGVSVAVLRTGALGRGIGRLGLGCGAVVLAATAAQYGAYVTLVAILWALCLAVALWRTVDERDVRGARSSGATDPRASRIGSPPGPVRPVR